MKFMFSSDIVVDLGGGNGKFSQCVHQTCELKNPIFCVDPAIKMIEIANTRDGVYGICDDAVSWLRSQQSSHTIPTLIIIKEMVHHIREEDFPEFVSHLRQIVSEGSRVIVQTRPKEPSGYPLFEAAKQVWRENQGSIEFYIDRFQSVGFKTELRTIPYHVCIAKEEWERLIRTRVWSTFSLLSDEELESGIAELDTSIVDTHYHFDDLIHFLLIE